MICFKPNSRDFTNMVRRCFTPASVANLFVIEIFSVAGVWIPEDNIRGVMKPKKALAGGPASWSSGRGENVPWLHSLWPQIDSLLS
jgi:hypothetical protein